MGRDERSPPGAKPAPRGGYAYPLFRSNHRQLEPSWSGPIYVWDIDNTYLVTEWVSFRDLLRIRFEPAEDKRPVPGVVELMAALRRLGPDEVRAPFYFVSASPEPMRAVLEKRMLLDGVVHDGITFRDLRKLRYLRDIFGYKTAALLLYRLENPPGAREVLFGDDREHDPSVYALYTRICAGQLRGAALRDHLVAQGVRRSASAYIASLAEELPQVDPVDWIIIRRLRPTTGESPRPDPRPEPDDRRVVFVDDFAQAAALLRCLQRIDAADLGRIVDAVRAAGGTSDPGAVLAAAPDLPPERVEATRRELAAVLAPPSTPSPSPGEEA